MIGLTYLYGGGALEATMEVSTGVPWYLYGNCGVPVREEGAPSRREVKVSKIYLGYRGCFGFLTFNVSNLMFNKVFFNYCLG